MSRRPRLLPPLLLAAVITAETARAAEVGAAFEGGPFAIDKTTAAAEIPKKGSSVDAFADVRLGLGSGPPRSPGSPGSLNSPNSLALGLGLTSVTAGSTSAARGVEQKITVRVPFLDARYLYEHKSGATLGLALRDQFGKGARYDVANSAKSGQLLALGLVAGYALRSSQWSVRPTLSYFFNVGDRQRSVTAVLVGLAVGYDLAPGPAAAPVTPGPTPPAVPETAPEDGFDADAAPGPEASAPSPAAPAPAPAPVSPVVVDLDDTVVGFGAGSAELRPSVAAAAKRIAKELLRLQASYTSVEVASHADAGANADTSLRLAQARADGLCRTLGSAGVPKARLVCKGYADAPAGAGKPGRTALTFSGVNDAQAAELRSAIDRAGKSK